MCSCTTVSTVSFGPYEQHPLELHEVAIVGSGVSSFFSFCRRLPVCSAHIDANVDMDEHIDMYIDINMIMSFRITQKHLV